MDPKSRSLFYLLALVSLACLLAHDPLIWPKDRAAPHFSPQLFACSTILNSRIATANLSEHKFQAHGLIICMTLLGDTSMIEDTRSRSADSGEHCTCSFDTSDTSGIELLHLIFDHDNASLSTVFLYFWRKIFDRRLSMDCRNVQACRQSLVRD